MVATCGRAAIPAAAPPFTLLCRSARKPRDWTIWVHNLLNPRARFRARSSWTCGTGSGASSRKGDRRRATAGVGALIGAGSGNLAAIGAGAALGAILGGSLKQRKD